MTRRTPLTPIFDEEPRSGSVNVGNTPGVEICTLELVGTLTDATNLNGPRGIVASGTNLVVVTSGGTADRLTIIDGSTRTAPSFVGQIGRATDVDFDGPREVVVSGSIAAVSCTLGWVFTVDISNPASPSFAGKTQDADFGVGSCSMGISGSSVLLTETGRFGIVDISTPSTPAFVADVTDATAYGFCDEIGAIGNYAYVPRDDTGNGVTVVDISTPATPSIVGSAVDATYLDLVTHVVPFDPSTVLALDAGGYITMIDVSTPSSPVVGASFDLTSWFYIGDLAVVGNRVAVLGSDAFATPTIALIDWSVPGSPVLLDTYADDTFTILDGAENMCTFGAGFAVTDRTHDRVLIFDLVGCGVPPA